MSGPRVAVEWGTDEAARLWNALPRVSSSPERSAEDDKQADWFRSIGRIDAERRDYFAAQAMREMIASGRYDADGFPDSLAMDAWRVADAMLEQEKGEG
jgi:hypothetical protein